MNRKHKGVAIPNRGFTLLEVLLAVSLVAMIMTIIYGAFSSALDTVDAIERQEETLRRGNFAMKSLIQNLSSAFIAYSSNRIDLDFIGESQELPMGEGDRMVFFSTSPMRGFKSIPTSVKMVVYDVEQTDRPTLADQLLTQVERFQQDRVELLVLRCFEIPQIGQKESDPQDQFGFGSSQGQLTPGFGPLSGRDFGQGIDLASLDPEELVKEGGTSWRIPIAGFSVQYFDGQGWIEQWSAMENGGLPRAVRLQLALAEEETLRRAALEGDEFEPSIIETIVTLPLGMSNTEEPEDEELEEETEQPTEEASIGAGGGDWVTIRMTEPEEEEDDLSSPASFA